MCIHVRNNPNEQWQEKASDNRNEISDQNSHLEVRCSIFLRFSRIGDISHLRLFSLGTKEKGGANYRPISFSHEVVGCNNSQAHR